MTVVGAGGTVVGAGGTVVGAGPTFAIAEASRGRMPKDCTRPKRAIELKLETQSFAEILNLDIYLVSLTISGDEFHILFEADNMCLSS